MKRRKYIQVVASSSVFSVGCIEQSSDTVMNKSPKNGREMSVSVEGSTAEVDVDIEVGYLNGHTDTQPARLRIRLTNEHSSKREFFFGASPPLSTYKGKNKEKQSELVLVPDNMEYISIEEKNGDGDFRLIPEEPTDGCWRVEDGIIRQDIVQSKHLKSKESISGEYTLLAGRRNEPCLPAGKYAFPAELKIGQETFNWRLVLEIGE